MEREGGNATPPVPTIDVTARSSDGVERGKHQDGTHPTSANQQSPVPASGQWLEQRVDPNTVRGRADPEGHGGHHPGANGSAARANPMPVAGSGSSASTLPISPVPWTGSGNGSSGGDQRDVAQERGSPQVTGDGALAQSRPGLSLLGHPTAPSTSNDAIDVGGSRGGDSGRTTPLAAAGRAVPFGGAGGASSMMPISSPTMATSAVKALARSSVSMTDAPMPYRRVAKRAWHTCATEAPPPGAPGAVTPQGAESRGQPTKAEATAAARAAAAAMAEAKGAVMGSQPPAKRSTSWRSVVSSPGATSSPPSAVAAAVSAPAPSPPTTSCVAAPVSAVSAASPSPAPATPTTPVTTPTTTGADAADNDEVGPRRPQADHRATAAAAAALAGLGGQWRPNPGENASYPSGTPGAAESGAATATTTATANTPTPGIGTPPGSGAPTAPTPGSGLAAHVSQQGQQQPPPSASSAAPAPAAPPTSSAGGATPPTPMMPTQTTAEAATPAVVAVSGSGDKTVPPPGGAPERGDPKAAIGAAASATAASAAPGPSTVAVGGVVVSQPPVGAAVVLPSVANNPPPPHPPPPFPPPVHPGVAIHGPGMIGVPPHGNGFPPGMGDAVGVIAPVIGAGMAVPPPSHGAVRYQATMRQWQAAENLVLNAFMLQESEPRERQEEAKAFFAKLADISGEPGGRVIALVRAAVQPAPWGSGYLVVSAASLSSRMVVS